MNTSVTLTITKNDNRTVGAHLSGFLNGNQESMEAIIPAPLLGKFQQSLIEIWTIMRIGQEVDKASSVERN